MTRTRSNQQKQQSTAADEAILNASWHQFNMLFPTDEACLHEIFLRSASADRTCSFCGSPNVTLHDHRILKCPDCKKNKSFTAGTFFSHMRCPRAWLGLIWLMDQGVCINPLKFHTLAGIAYASANGLFKKITTVIQEAMGNDATEVSSALFSDLFCKRSRETPARSHPVAEQEEIDKLSPATDPAPEACHDANTDSASLASDSLASSSIDCQPQEVATPGSDSELTERQIAVFNCLSQESISLDALCEKTKMPVNELLANLMFLELTGDAKSLPGDQFIRCLPKPAKKAISASGETIGIVDTIIDFVRLNHQGISRKYLQNYLAAYWYHTDKKRWTPGSLLDACLRSRYIHYNNILAYVSPPAVKILPCVLT